MFRTVDFDSSEYFYNSAIDHNIKLIQNLNISQNLKYKFALLVALYPLSEDKFEMFSNMSKISKTGFLSKYLMKICKQKGVSDVLLSSYNKLKKEFHDKKYIMISVSERQDRIDRYVNEKNAPKLLEIYKIEIELDYTYQKLVNMTKMLINIVTLDFNKHYNKRFKKKQKENNTLPYNPYQNANHNIYVATQPFVNPIPTKPSTKINKTKQYSVKDFEPVQPFDLEQESIQIEYPPKIKIKKKSEI